MKYRRRADNELENIATTVRRDHGRFDGRRLLIEDVVQQMGYDLIPIEGLVEQFCVEAYIGKRPKTIYVDRAEMDGGTPRYFFTLAEEVAHIFLHLNNPPPGVTTPAQFHEWVMSMNQAEYNAFECDAKHLAGAMLMPPDEFTAKFNSLSETQTKALGKHSDRCTVQRYVLRQLFMTYAVSFNAAAIRARKLGLISEADLKKIQEYQHWRRIGRHQAKR